jgi:riboflavin kinase, archaea type
MISMIDPGDLQCLKAIALMGGCRGPVWISSQSLGDTLAMSPQTASRRLKSLEALRLVDRSLRPDGQYVAVTKEGEESLRKEYDEYNRIFGEGAGPYSLTGSVISGLGEGRYYMSLAPYREQFQRMLGCTPFPGTLNLRLSSASRDVKRKVDALPWTRIQGFVQEGRTFGEARTLPCRIGDIACAIVVPGRSHYPDDVIEVIAGVELRTSLGLSDGDLVTVEVTHA